MAYWLMKSEPDCFSIDDLKKAKQHTAHWDGVRNYQARNWLRDTMRVDDLAFFYQSSCKTPGIVGTMTIVRAGYPDFTASDPNSDHYDPGHTQEKPRWYMVDVKLQQIFPNVITLPELRQHPELEDLRLLQKGNRLSIMPVSTEHWHAIMTLI